MTMPADLWLGRWQDPKYHAIKMDNVQTMIQHLGTPPRRVLDIGAGPAFESRALYKQHNTDIWLLDGDFDTTADRQRAVSFGPADSMKFYSRLSDLNALMQQDDIKNYHLVDAHAINIPDDIKFDVIYSFLSCGFHYPVDVYRDLVLKHSHAETRYIFELRNNVVHNVEIVARLSKRKKSTVCEVRF